MVPFRRLRVPRWVAAAATVAALAAFVSGCTGDGKIPPVAECTARNASGASSSTSRPNIVFVLTDDLSTDLVRYMPHVQAMQEAGTSFSNYTVTDSLCCPSRASIFTGRFPHNTGVFTNEAPDGGYEVYERNHNADASFAVALQKAGYRTAMMGKFLNGYDLGAGRDPGWSEWDVAGSGYRGFDYEMNQNDHVVEYGRSPSDYVTDVVSRRANRFIGACPAGRRTDGGGHPPFMLEVATFAPHKPYVPAPRDRHRLRGLRYPHTAAFNRLPENPPRWLAARKPLTAGQKAYMNRVFRKRVRSVQAVDRMIGALQAAVRRAGEADNTYFVFSSDNGYHLGEYRLPRGKMTAFDTDVRVPLVVVGPGIPAGRVTSALASNIDLAPTFEELAGAPPREGVDGRSLVPVLHGRTPSDWRTAALVEHRKPTSFTIGPDDDGKKSSNPPSYAAMRTSSYTYVEYVDGSREFYDLEPDPLQLRNLAPTLPPATLSELHRDLAALKSCRGARACAVADRPGPLPGA